MVERPSPAQLREDGRDGMRPGLDGPDGVLAVARPEAALLLLPARQRNGPIGPTAAAHRLPRHRLRLQHDGALGLVDQAQLAEPKVHGVSAKEMSD